MRGGENEDIRIEGMRGGENEDGRRGYENGRERKKITYC